MILLSVFLLLYHKTQLRRRNKMYLDLILYIQTTKGNGLHASFFQG